MVRPRVVAVLLVVSVVWTVVGLPAARADHEPGHPPQWNLLGNAATTPGTHFLGTTDNNRLEIKVNNSRALRIEPGDPPNLIGGHPDNAVTGGVVGATIAGGGFPAFGNLVTDNWGTVGGGRANQAGNDDATLTNSVDATVAGGLDNDALGQDSTIAGGSVNRALGLQTTIGGGRQNVARLQGDTVGGGRFNDANGGDVTVSGGAGNIGNGTQSTIGGGLLNRTSSQDATVPGGRENTAAGFRSFAAGHRAKANHSGSFVWADSQDFDFASTASEQLSVRATGGVRLVPAINGAGVPTASMQLLGGAPDTGLLQVENADPVTAGRTLFELVNNGGPRFFFTDTSPSGVDWQFSKLSNHNFTVSDLGDGGPELVLQPNGILRVGDSGTSKLVLDTAGNLTIAGTLAESSDRAKKTGISSVDVTSILASLRRLTVSSWKYKEDPKSLLHVGPMAQDVHRLLGVGTSTTISPRDIASFALLVAQELDRQVRELRGTLADLSAQR